MRAEHKVVQTAARATRALRWLATAGSIAALAACGGGGSGGGEVSAGQGTLRVALTDAPACGYDHVWVTIDKVSVNRSSTASETDSGWSDLTLSPARRVDLLELTNGVLEELGSMPLAAGSYSQVRLVLASNSGSSATANAVQPTGGAVTPLTTPSAQQSGLKLQAKFDVAAGQMADLVLDFDACKSVVKAGNSGQYILKPVVAAVPRVVTGLQGYVATTMPLASTTVSAQQNGVTVRATTPDAAGKFSIPYLAAGSYTLVVKSEGRATGVITSVPVGTATTVINGSATAITTPASAMAEITGATTTTTASGSGTVTQVLTEATVQAQQTLSGGPTIELGSQAVDSTLGTYRFRLPVGAPVKAAYASPTTTLVLTPDATAAGKYTLVARTPGRTDLTRQADISGGGNLLLNLAWSP